MRRTLLPAVTRLGTLVVLGVVLALAVPPAGAAMRAQTAGAGSVAELEQRLRDAQAASTAAAARFQEATAKHEALVDEIAAVEERIASGQTRAAELRAIAVHRAVTAYKSREVTEDTSAMVLGSGDVMKELRRHALLQRANARDNAAVAALAALEEDLGIQKDELQEKRADAKQLVDRLESEESVLAAAVADAQSAYDELVDRLAREAASRAAAERAAQQVAAEAAKAATVSSREAAPTGTPVAGFLCPVHGPFTNDFGDPRSGGRSHSGIDIFAGTGTPVVAVKSGSISFEQGGAGGNAVVLSGSDGNTYYYAHLSAYEGGARSVSQGEVIGYVGQTGSATTPHLHFEIRTPSGLVNPYATLSSSC